MDDYASPFCYIAFHKLTEAVKAVGIDQNKLDYNFRAFQIDRTATENPTQTRGEKLMKKDGLTQKQLHERFQNITDKDVLIKLAKDARLDDSYAKKILTSEEYKDVVIEDENDLANRNADTVPYFEIGHYHDEGVPTKEALIEAINNLIYQKAN